MWIFYAIVIIFCLTCQIIISVFIFNLTFEKISKAILTVQITGKLPVPIQVQKTIKACFVMAIIYLSYILLILCLAVFQIRRFIAENEGAKSGINLSFVAVHLLTNIALWGPMIAFLFYAYYSSSTTFESCEEITQVLIRTYQLLIMFIVGIFCSDLLTYFAIYKLVSTGVTH